MINLTNKQWRAQQRKDLIDLIDSHGTELIRIRADIKSFKTPNPQAQWFIRREQILVKRIKDANFILMNHIAAFGAE